jgi:hypothetical protein
MGMVKTCICKLVDLTLRFLHSSAVSGITAPKTRQWQVNLGVKDSEVRKGDTY